MRRIFALLDSPFLTRVGNLRTLGSVAVLGVAIVIVAILAVLSIGPWWPVAGATAMWLTAMIAVAVATRRNKGLPPTSPSVIAQPARPAPPARSERAASSLTPASARSDSSHVLREQLQDFYNEGERIREALPQSAVAGSVAMVSRAMSGQRETTGEDVEKWEAAVVALLRDRAEWRYWFTSDPPAIPRGAAAMFLSVSRAVNDTPLRRRMNHRLRQLARIIERADGRMR